MNWTDSVQISTDPSFLNVRLSSYALLRTTVEYPLRVWNREVRAALIVSNVTDKRYYRGSSRGEPRSFGLRLSSVSSRPPGRRFKEGVEKCQVAQGVCLADAFDQ